MTPKFWSIHLDPILALDLGLFIILTAQINLTVGTLARHLSSRPDLVPLVNALLKGDVIGLFLLTERGHGLDAINIETTAHQQEDGSYILHTPCEEATKYVVLLFGVVSLMFIRSHPDSCLPPTRLSA